MYIRSTPYNVVYLPTSMDLPSVFNKDKIQDQSVSTMYLTVLLDPPDEVLTIGGEEPPK
jgi:hypothetical protein